MQYIAIANDSLAHVGVKGMKWGYKRASSELSKSTKKIAKQEVRTTNKKAYRESRDEMLKRTYKGKTSADHAIKALAGIGLSQLGGSMLISSGSVEVGAYLGTFGTALAVGSFVGDMLNQKEYDRRFGNE